MPQTLGCHSRGSFVSTPHIDGKNKQGNSCLQLLKATSGLEFGDKETLHLTYNTLVKPVFTYGAAIFFPITDLNATSIKRLQCLQNSCMRVITGAHKSTSVDHLLAEIELPPVSEHLGLICKQFLASASRRSHPSHATVQQQTGVRKGRKKMVHTLQSRFGDTVRPFLTDGVLSEISYKKTIAAIHSKVVADNKSKLVNKVLGVAPPRNSSFRENPPAPQQNHLVPAQIRRVQQT
jgi:hypothetical protein